MTARHENGVAIRCRSNAAAGSHASLVNTLCHRPSHRQVMIGYRKIGTDSVIGFFARNGNGRDIFALATNTLRRNT